MKVGGRRQSLRAININLNDIHSLPEQETVDDLLYLSSLEESDLIRHIEGRFRRSQIYTKAGPVLISMNPFFNVMRFTDNVSIYSDTVLREYVQNRGKDLLKSLNVSAESLVPHIFSVASAAFSLLETGDQAILISGESGAGKTEATKHCLNFLANAKRLQVSNVTNITTGLAQRLLDINPVLEALGNAMTSRNNNSSRFGKWMEVSFNPNKEVISARVTQFLLEKSRITNQSPMERSFHIFYYMCHGTSQLEKERYYIHPEIDRYKYFMKTKKVVAPPGTDNVARWREFLDCLLSIGCREEEVDQVIRIISGIMLLGNIPLIAQNDGATTEGPVLETVADLFGISSTCLLQAITTREIIVVKKSTTVNLSLAESESAREGFAKNFYCRLFDWVVATINRNLSQSETAQYESNFIKRNLVGLLDIFGFENFDNNSFEQLCINYANEKLHQHYIKHIIQSEFQLFQDEGIQYEFITFGDNKRVIDLIEDPMAGIFAILNDKSMLAVQGTDESYSSQLDKTHAANSCFRCAPPSKRNQCFTIRHSPADIVYSVSGFVEKNKDKLQKLIEIGMASSTVGVIQRIFRPEESDTVPKEIVGKRALLESFASFKFSQDIKSLLTIIEAMNPHFVRCIKSNSTKSPMTLDLELVLHQFRYLGIIDLCNIRTKGFFFRDTYKNVCLRYKDLIPGRFLIEGKSNTVLRKVVEDMLTIVVRPTVLPSFVSKMLLRRGASAEVAQSVMDEIRKHRNQGAKTSIKTPYQRDTSVLNMKQEIQYGINRVFLRRGAYDIFEEALDKRMDQMFYSASLIQAHMRSYMQSYIYKAHIMGQRIILTRIKGFIYRTRFKKLKKISLFLSSKYRMMTARQGYAYMYGSVVRLQKAWRRHKNQSVMKMIKQAIMMIRPKVRLAISKGSTLQKYRTGKKIADWVHEQHCVRRRFKAVAKIAICYQKWSTYRKFALTHKPIINYLLTKRRERLVRRVARRFKTYCKTVSCRRLFLRMRASSIILQKRIRCWLAHSRISRLIRSCKFIQKIVRGVLLRNRLMRVFRWISRVEGWYLTLAMRKRYLTLLRAAIDVKTWWKQILERKHFVKLRHSSICLQKWIRGTFAVRRFQNLVTNIVLEKELSNCRKTELDSLKKHLRTSIKGIRAFDIDVAISLVDCYGHNGIIQSIHDLDSDFALGEQHRHAEHALEEISSVQVGFSHCLCLTSRGNVWQKSDSDPDWCSIPFVVDYKTLTVLRIAAGENHSIVLCSNNSLFGWGSNCHGQVGVGSNESMIEFPQLIRNLTLYKGEYITKICAGALHSIVLSDLGLVYSWGVSSCLGIGISGDVAAPVLVSYFSQVRVADISCGLNFSVACGDNGSVYCWGNNKHNQIGQLSHSESNCVLLPVQHAEIQSIITIASANQSKRRVGHTGFVKRAHIDPVCHEVIDKVMTVSCGSFHSAAVTESGKVLTWGRNESGQLGVKKYDNCSDNRSVYLPLEDVRVLQAECGLRQTFCVSSEGKIFAFGRLYALSGGHGWRGRDADSRNFVPENCLPPKPAMYNMDESGRIILAMTSSDVRRGSISDSQLRHKNIPLAIKVVWSRSVSFVSRTDEKIGNDVRNMTILTKDIVDQNQHTKESWIDANHFQLQRQLSLTDRQLHIMLTSGTTSRFKRKHQKIVTKYRPKEKHVRIKLPDKHAAAKKSATRNIVLPVIDMMPHFDRRVILRSMRLQRLRICNRMERRHKPWKVIQEKLAKSFKESLDDLAFDNEVRTLLLDANPAISNKQTTSDEMDARTDIVQSNEGDEVSPKQQTRKFSVKEGKHAKPGKKKKNHLKSDKEPSRSSISNDFLKSLVGDSASLLSESRSFISGLQSSDQQDIVFGKKLSGMVSGHVKKIKAEAVPVYHATDDGNDDLSLEGLKKSRKHILSSLPEGIAFDWETNK